MTSTPPVEPVENATSLPCPACCEGTPAQEKKETAVTITAEPPMPPTLKLVRGHFDSLVAGAACHAESYLDSKSWEKHTGAWQLSSTRWLFKRISQQRVAAAIDSVSRVAATTHGYLPNLLEEWKNQSRLNDTLRRNRWLNLA